MVSGRNAMNNWDWVLGMNADITRREFLNGKIVPVGGAAHCDYTADVVEFCGDLPAGLESLGMETFKLLYGPV